MDRAVAEEERRVHSERAKVAIYFMAVPLVLSFSAVDYFFRPDLWQEFVLIRLSVIPVTAILAVLFWLDWARGPIKTFVPALLFLAYLGVYSAYLGYRSGGDSSPYYAGLNLVAIGALSFLPWPTRFLPLVAALIYGPHLVSLIFDEQIAAQDLVPQLAFIGSTLFLSTVTHHLTSRLRAREMLLRLQLKTEIETKDQVIEDKTRHGIFLEKLALQFSPQVIEAIKGGMLDINDRVRQPISCIFIDIENSTARSHRLDNQEYSDLVSQFFSDCIETLLKHDVTVGTYLGDGLMAFTNAPVQAANHQQAALDACLDILNLHARKRAYFSERWRTDFNIRIGINTGFASVGFFPNSKRGTYTAIGDVVNLAARLCGRAPANSICVTKAFLRDLTGHLKNLKVESCGTTSTIKGFEGDRFELYAVRTLQSIGIELKGRHQCPLCSDTLVVAERLGDVDATRCPSCGYHDFIERKADHKAA